MRNTVENITGDKSDENASRKPTNTAAYLRRVNAERLLALVINELVAEHPNEKFRILPDNQLTGDSSADFLLQVDDYDVRLELLDSPDQSKSVDLELLNRSTQILENNPSTITIILVWSTKELSSLPLTLKRIRYLSENSNMINELGQRTRPLKQVISDLVSRQIKIWDFDLPKFSQTSGQSRDLFKLFSDEIGKTIDAEMRRNYQNLERKQAAQQFPHQQEKEVILSVLQEALHGYEAELLAEHLGRVPKRGIK